MRISVSLMLCLALLLMPGTSYSNQAQDPPHPEKITLQLKWFHQFQFAGYYAAKEKGYYAEEGLEVDIRERAGDKDTVKQVVSGEVDYAIGDSGIISHFARGEPIIALAAIFQHSPLVFIAKQSSGIMSPYEMAGKRIMLDTVGAGSAPLRAMLAEAHLAEKDYTAIPQSFRNDDLIENKFDVMLAYLSDQFFYFKEKGLKINVINPQSYGIDFYGDILFTSEQELAGHPGRVEKFRRASLKGWQYAMDHPDELIELIHTQYHSKLSLKHLKFESEVTRKLILPDSVPIGQIKARRLHQVSEVYAQLKLSRPLSEGAAAQFIYTSQTLNLTAAEQAWLKAHPAIILGIDNDFAPYEWLDAKGNYVGLAADYLVQYQRLLGVKFILVKDKSWAEILDMAREGQVDMLSAAVETPERREFLTFTDPFVSNPIIIVNDSRSGFIGSLDRLSGKKVAVEKGYFMEELVSRDYPDIRLVPANNVKEALNQVADGKADAYIGDAASAHYAIHESGLLNLGFSGNTGYTSAHSVAVAKKHPELAGIMAKVLAAIPADERERIADRWMGIKVSTGISTKTLAGYVLASLFVLLVFAAWNLRLRREIAKRKKVEQRLRTLSVAIEQSPASVVITDLDARLLYVNPRFTEVTGYSAQEVLGENPRILQSGLTGKETFGHLWASLARGEIWRGELINRRKNGEVYWESAHIAPVKNPAGVTCQYVAIKLDITQSKFLEEKLRFLFEFAPLGFSLNDLETGRFIEINDAMCIGSGYSKAELLTLDYWKLTPGEYAAQEQQQLEALERTGRYGPYEKEFIRKDGSRYPVLLNGMVMQDFSGRKLIWSIIEDITGRKEAEMQLKKTNMELQRYFNQPFIGMLTSNPNKKTISINQCFCEMVGYSAEEMQVINWGKITHPDDLAPNQALLDQTIRGEIESFQMEKRYLHKDGHIVYTELAVECIRKPDGTPDYFIGMIRDITQRKLMELELHIAAIAFESQQGILITDAKHVILRVNQAFTRISGYSADEVIGKTPGQLSAGNDDNPKQSIHWHSVGRTGNWEGEVWSRRKNGGLYPAWLTLTAIKDADGRVHHYVASFVDITERKQIEQKTQALVYRNQILMDNALEGIHILNAQGDIVECNRTFCRLLGYAPEELLGLNVSAWEARIPAGELPAKLTRLLEGEAVFETLHRRKDGSLIDVEVTAVGVELDGEKCIYASSRDITGRKQIEQELKASESRFRAMIEITPVPTALVNAESNKIIFVNPAFTKTFGYTVNDIPTLSDWWELAYPDPDYRAWVMQVWSGMVGRTQAESPPGSMIEANICCKDGSQKTVMAADVVIFEDTSKFYLAVLYDITERKQAEKALLESQLRWKFAIEGAGDGVWDWNIQTHHAQYSRRWKEMLGYADEDILPTIDEWKNRIHPEDRRHVSAAMQAYLEGRSDIYVVEYRLQCKDGGYKWILGRGMVVSRSEDGKPLRMVGTHTDISGQKQIETNLRIAATVFESQEGMLIADADNRILRVNKAFTQITGYTEAEVIGKNPKILSSDRHDKAFYAELWRRIQADGVWEGEIWDCRKNGEVYPQWLCITAVKGDCGTNTHYVATLTDITGRKATEAHIHKLAFYDVLTELPNRSLLHERIKHGIEINRRSGNQMAVLMLDLDKFKQVNDTLGHSVGDELLQQVAKRIESQVRKMDTVARLGGDEFVVMIEQISHYEDTFHVAENIISALKQPFILSHKSEVYIGTSIGIAIYPLHGDTLETLMDNADTALYHAKDQGRGCFAYFSEELTRKAHDKIELEASLRRAVDKQELQVYFQPQICIKTGRIIGAEALVRWHDPVKGVRIPKDFIAMAEETGVIIGLGEWVLRETCRQGQAWLAQGLPPIGLAVNVSPYQFRRCDLNALVAKILAETGFPAGSLELEITESGLMDNQEQAMGILKQLHQQGVRLAIDDFGTGYSSLAYLKYFPLDVLKIDKTFIDDIPLSADDMAITSTIIAMAHSLGFKVLAEGVETQAQLSFLQDHGCDFYQGYFYDQPLSAAEFAGLLSRACR